MYILYFIFDPLVCPSRNQHMVLMSASKRVPILPATMNSVRIFLIVRLVRSS
jgi:hypothetical protein